MFSKPALFPKAADPQSARGPRPGQGSVASTPASSLSGSSGESAAPKSGLTGMGAAQASTLATPSALTGSTTTTTAAEAPAAPDNDLAEVGGSRLIVGPDVKLKGAEILDCDTLVVEGRVEATMDSRVIRIAENGAFSGTVGIDVAEVYGRFDGELTARSQLIIHSTGRVSGKIRYGKILIEEGGEISGDVQSLSAASAKEASRVPERIDSPVKVAQMSA